MSIYRTVFSYILKKAGPVRLNQSKVPEFLSWQSDADKRRKLERHKNYWHFIEDHRIELSKKENSALQKYRDDSTELNRYLRDTSQEFNPNLEEQAHHINRAILRSPLKRPVSVWRSIHFSPKEPITEKLLSMGLIKPAYPRAKDHDWARNPTKAELDSLVGFKFKEPAFASTTLIPDGIWKDGQIFFNILVERGQPALATNSAYAFDDGYMEFYEGTSHEWAKEHEILLSQDTVFQIESVSYNPPKYRYRFSRNPIHLKVRVVDK